MKKGRQGDGGGHPHKMLTVEQISQVEGLASVLSVAQMADYFAIGRTTFFAILKRQPEVDELYKKGRANAINFIGTSLIEKARNGDTTAQIFYLKSQGGWKEKQDINVDLQSSDGTMSPKTLTLEDFYKDKNKEN